MARLQKIEVRMHETPDQQISLTDPDARSMATSGRGTGMVGHIVQLRRDQIPNQGYKYLLVAAKQNMPERRSSTG